jgi:hypothetical protein
MATSCLKLGRLKSVEMAALSVMLNRMVFDPGQFERRFGSLYNALAGKAVLTID